MKGGAVYVYPFAFSLPVDAMGTFRIPGETVEASVFPSSK